MNVERQEGSGVQVDRGVPRVLQRYSVYRIMTAKGSLLAGSYKETSSLALGPQASPLTSNP